jgi:hypothetical protein
MTKKRRRRLEVGRKQPIACHLVGRLLIADGLAVLFIQDCPSAFHIATNEAGDFI